MPSFNGNALVLQMVVAMRATGYVLKADRNRGSLFKGSEKILVAFHVARQLINRNVREALSRPSVCDTSKTDTTL